MSYNYDQDYLERNIEMVRKLIDTWKTGTEFVLHKDSSSAIATGRNLIRGILANLSSNYPDFADIRRAVITWVTRERDGSWLLHVGVEKPKKMRGGRPPIHMVALEKPPDTYGMYDTEAKAMRYMETVSMRNFPKLIEHLRTQGPKLDPILLIEVVGDIPLDMLQEAVKPWNYTATQHGPTTIQLVRNDAKIP